MSLRAICEWSHVGRQLMRSCRIIRIRTRIAILLWIYTLKTTEWFRACVWRSIGNRRPWRMTADRSPNTTHVRTPIACAVFGRFPSAPVLHHPGIHPTWDISYRCTERVTSGVNLVHIWLHNANIPFFTPGVHVHGARQVLRQTSTPWPMPHLP